jgi:hypothetical protein
MKVVTLIIIRHGQYKENDKLTKMMVKMVKIMIARFCSDATSADKRDKLASATFACFCFISRRTLYLQL